MLGDLLNQGIKKGKKKIKNNSDLQEDVIDENMIQDINALLINIHQNKKKHQFDPDLNEDMKEAYDDFIVYDRGVFYLPRPEIQPKEVISFNLPDLSEKEVIDSLKNKDYTEENIKLVNKVQKLFTNIDNQETNDTIKENNEILKTFKEELTTHIPDTNKKTEYLHNLNFKYNHKLDTFENFKKLPFAEKIFILIQITFINNASMFNIQSSQNLEASINTIFDLNLDESQKEERKTEFIHSIINELKKIEEHLTQNLQKGQEPELGEEDIIDYSEFSRVFFHTLLTKKDTLSMDRFSGNYSIYFFNYAIHFIDTTITLGEKIAPEELKKIKSFILETRKRYIDFGLTIWEKWPDLYKTKHQSYETHQASTHKYSNQFNFFLTHHRYFAYLTALAKKYPFHNEQKIDTIQKKFKEVFTELSADDLKRNCQNDRFVYEFLDYGAKFKEHGIESLLPKEKMEEYVTLYSEENKKTILNNIEKFLALTEDTSFKDTPPRIYLNPVYSVDQEKYYSKINNYFGEELFNLIIKNPITEIDAALNKALEKLQQISHKTELDLSKILTLFNWKYDTLRTMTYEIYLSTIFPYKKELIEKELKNLKTTNNLEIIITNFEDSFNTLEKIKNLYSFIRNFNIPETASPEMKKEHEHKKELDSETVNDYLQKKYHFFVNFLQEQLKSDPEKDSKKYLFFLLKEEQKIFQRKLKLLANNYNKENPTENPSQSLLDKCTALIQEIKAIQEQVDKPDFDINNSHNPENYNKNSYYIKEFEYDQESQRIILKHANGRRLY